MKNWKRTFFTIWTGQAFSILSSAIIQYAMIWYLTDHTGSPLVLSMAALAGFLPQGLLSPIAGVYVDRWDRKKTMIFADAFIAAVSLSLVIFGFISDEIPTWLFMVVLALRSAGSAFHFPAMSAATPQIVPPEMLTKCAGYSQAIQSVSLVVSPPLAAVLFANVELPWIIMLDIIGAAIAIFTLLIVKIPKLDIKPKTEKVRLWEETKDGLRALRSHKGFLPFVIFVGALSTLAYIPLAALFPLMTTSYFMRDVADASIVEMASSLGMIIGSVILGIWGGTKNKMHTVTISLFVMGIPMVLMGMISPSMFWTFVILSAIMGFSYPFYGGVAMSVLQKRVEPEYLGRVMSISNTIMTLAGPFGLLMSGFLAEAIGIENQFIISGILTIICGFICILTPSIRNCDAENPGDKRDRVSIAE